MSVTDSTPTLTDPDGVEVGNVAQPLVTSLAQGGNVAAVKAASTPAVAADKALVVAFSPNNPITVNPQDPSTPTYSSQADAFTIGNPATDVFTITGSATKKVVIRRLKFSGRRTSAGDFAYVLTKRSTANSGGVITNGSPRTTVPHDSADPAATATVRAYTTSPTTLGTLVGDMRSGRAFFSGSGSSSVPLEEGYEFGGTDKAITLRGTNEVLAINFRGQNIAGGEVCAYVEWTEE